MKMRFLCMVAAVGLLAACSSDEPKKQEAAAVAPTAPMTKAEPPKVVDSIVPGSQADFVKNVGDRVFFDYDKSALKPEGKDQLAKWVAFLKKYPNDKLLVEGHADERGTREYNLALGERRANTVKEFLVANGVAADRLKTVSYGKERPVVMGSNEAAWAQNRRGVGVIQ